MNHPMKTIARNAAAMALIGAATLLPSVASAQNAGVQVVVNGQAMTFDQPPVEQAGRVFVPLRSIFEQLGASVVYQSGTINATQGSRTVTLQIGSTQATVNGQVQTLDAPPFVDGARTLVPLRFVAQALGATVNWNDNTSTVTIRGGGYRGGQYGGGNAAPALNPDQWLVNRWPYNGAQWKQDQIRATFVQHVRSNSIRITLDGNDLTANASLSRTGFVLPMQYRLQPGRHHVRISAVTVSGQSFTTGWDFTV
jgi:hypothetical protein